MATASKNYSATELMVCAAARLLEDNASVLVGTGMPVLAAILAQRTHAPNLLIIFEAGGIGPQVPILPFSVGQSHTFYKAHAASSMHEVMSACQAGLVDYGFLGGAMIDRFGNLNTTVIGDWQKPAARLPGSGGANDVGSLCRRTIILIRQDQRRFVERVNFLTTPGYLHGPGAREQAGLPENTGPYRVITQLGVYGFDQATRQMHLVSIHPGVTPSEIQDNSAFEIMMPAEVPITPAPTAAEQQILYSIDPLRIIISK
jgi:acyl CoA:acetate/3-ketoacid CoA transferase beta subunit